ncbi:hypothetical protein SCARR_03265 [Pontiella sulfatireligans]|uniref:Uncharacterized protein n=1 Tax=Pontiella sulfatireligans TaxID=2750658 RepID=A0A6C2UPF0_9BACT|nr:hypothetical protein SCARR_03265 [Pontiella sulfatireligans]
MNEEGLPFGIQYAMFNILRFKRGKFRGELEIN